MNHTCQGDVILRHGRRWGRCLLDSFIFEIKEPIKTCPHCNRKWTAVSENMTARDLKQIIGVIEEQIDFPALKEVLRVVREDIRFTGPFKITASAALKKALANCSDLR